MTTSTKINSFVNNIVSDHTESFDTYVKTLTEKQQVVLLVSNAMYEIEMAGLAEFYRYTSKEMVMLTIKMLQVLNTENAKRLADYISMGNITQNEEIRQELSLLIYNSGCTQLIFDLEDLIEA